MAARQSAATKAAAEQPTPEPEAPAEQPVDEQPVDEQATTGEAAAIEGSDTTTDYTRRAGGYVLTDRGWVIEPQTDDEQVEGSE